MSPPTAKKLTEPSSARCRAVFFSLLLSALALAVSAPPTLAEKNLFNSEPSSTTPASAQDLVSPDEGAAYDEPAISATDAALRAQQHIDGKVMNVRQFQDEDRTLYGVKVLQKNGRMKTINIDANSGSVVE